ncbi:pyridoxal-5'-phosphate-dependent protein [Tardibacter chloracetimidivorans]|uniref:Pyridoxal-5'-phosphate-dependent protein n=1 Tax=Tardibacter chloracetimidivorans TaxID=1921510 RepID=A0A1L3ZYC7_9SPHN|nr:DegT/DnrJ/EryC1/StrS family aminotransferase [Tardibacter chloracetimidivorans]API60631.1 pyridoxal-5'-phosphate-dependent protein [Tardibacter chloracetimidivorans]
MILMNDFKAEPAEIRTAMTDAAARVFASGWYVLGQEVKAFEERWAETCGTPHCIGVGNGMDAIELVLRALEIGDGDEVITTSMTAFATTLAIMRAGAIPVLADIEPDSGLLAIESARRCVSPRTRAIVLVHLYGQVRDMDGWEDLCREHAIELIEDCAQSHLSCWDGVTAGAFGTAGTYSFYPTKNLGAIGDGGAVVTHRSHLAERISQLRNYGQSERYKHPFVGMNSRLDELQAAILSERLRWLPSFTDRRRAIAQRYDNEIDNPEITLLAPPQQALAHSYHLYVVLCERRDALAAHLLERGIQTHAHYPVPVHLQQPCLDLQRDRAGLECSERHAATCLSIPCHPQLGDENVDRVIEALNGF